MSYIWATLLLCIFFIWAIILEEIASFLIHYKINFQYPFIRNIPQLLLLTTCSISLFAATQTSLPQYPVYLLFISALWITVHTDLKHMLISRLVSLYLIPVGILASILGLLPITYTESILASALAGGFLIATNKIFAMIKGHDGLGQGDIELLAFIGAWIGFLGTWCTIVIGSVTGTIIGSAYLLWTHKQIRILPFGPFLALGAIMFLIFWTHMIIVFL